MTGKGGRVYYMKQFLNFKGFFCCRGRQKNVPEWWLALVKAVHKAFTLLCFPAVCLMRHTVVISLLGGGSG